ncbi:MAG: homoserine kinase, partial [Acidimicrobiia bacterium]
PERPEAGREDAVLRAAREIVSERPLAMVVDNVIPIGRGLGSSSAAAVAGAAAALWAVGREPDPADLARVVAELDGHPDNAAASVYGGLVAVAGSGRVVGLELHSSLRPVVAVPGHSLSTLEARTVLPDPLPRQVAVGALPRLVMLLEGLRSGRADLLGEAAGDQLHEAPRARLHPKAAELIAVARSGGASHACWSGAGPAVLALAHPGHLSAVVAALEGALDAGGRVLVPEVARPGLRREVALA